MTFQSALVVEVPESEPIVGSLRDSFDAVSKLGMPAHITILYPFIKPSDIHSNDLDRIGRLIYGFTEFCFSLKSVGRFPETTYLKPTPEEPFIEMTEVIYKSYPLFPPFGGIHDTVIPHLTVSNGNSSTADIVEKELNDALSMNGDINSCCKEIVLMSNQSGRWERMNEFMLST